MFSHWDNVLKYTHWQTGSSVFNVFILYTHLLCYNEDNLRVPLGKRYRKLCGWSGSFLPGSCLRVYFTDRESTAYSRSYHHMVSGKRVLQTKSCRNSLLKWNRHRPAVTNAAKTKPFRILNKWLCIQQYQFRARRCWGSVQKHQPLLFVLFGWDSL